MFVFVQNLHPNSEKTYFGGPEKIKNFGERIWDLIEAVLNDPFSGIGKLEPLKHLGSNFWSRRIDQEHRLIYHVEKERILFLQARFHYGDR